MFSLRDLARPIVGAPMAGGPGTPELAAAVTEAGGVGFLPAAYLTAAAFAEDIAAARQRTTGPLGVNLFVPQPSLARPAALAQYRDQLRPLAVRYGTEPGYARPDDDDWAAKLDVIADLTPEVVSFTFGCPTREVLARLHSRGVSTAVTVTSAEEADAAAAAGAKALVVQGPEAGGHRGTFDPGRTPGDESLDALLLSVHAHCLEVVAAGGLAHAADVRRVLDLGAVAAQVGTALLRCDEAGTNAVHRQALTEDQFTRTVVTRAFSGRYARALANQFTDEFDPVAPLGYPEVNQLTGPVRRAAVAAGDPHGTNLWAGTAWRHATVGGAVDIVERLSQEVT